MKLTVIGTGYVGLVTGTCFAEVGNEVICIDIDKKKIENLKKGIMPIYEPGLEELVKRNFKEGRLQFSDNISEGIRHGLVIFSAVGTPPDKGWNADLTAVKKVAEDFGKNINEFKIFVNKSTVPVGTSDICEDIIKNQLIKRKKDIKFDIASNPEFLREGSAIKDTMNPSRIIVGTESTKTKEVMDKLYSPFVRTNNPLIFMNTKSAEIAKYASNSFLAAKISFINEIANFCEKAGGDVKEVALGMGLDDRIGSRFLYAGIGYGGSCFPKDVQALTKTGKQYGYDFRILDAVEAVNKSQKKKLFKKLKDVLPNLEGKHIAVFGLAFKPKTDDMRDAPSIKVIKKLQAEGAIINAFDPVSMENARNYFSKVNLRYAKNALDAAKNVDAVIVMTEWDEFRSIDLNELKSVMKGNIVIDGRNIYNPKDMKEHGFIYSSIGRKST